MTTSTKDQEAVAAMAQKRCRTCLGDELLMQNGEGDKPCLDCRLDGKPTGLLLPGLVKPCPSTLTHQSPGLKRHEVDGPLCEGYVPVSPPEALAYLLNRPECWRVERTDDGWYVCWGVKPSGVEANHGEGETIILALAAAIEQHHPGSPEGE